MLSGEMLEEVFEQLIEAGIAGGLAWIFTNSITNTLFIFGIVQASKVTIKKIVAIIIKPIIKQITFKEGNDKVEKLKKVFNYLANELATNPKALTSLGLTGLSDSAVGILVYALSRAAELPEGANVFLAVFVPLVAFTIVACVILKEVHEKPVSKEDRAAEKLAKAQRKADDELTRKAREQMKKNAEKAEAEKKAEDEARLVQLRMQELEAAEKENKVA